MSMPRLSLVRNVRGFAQPLRGLSEPERLDPQMLILNAINRSSVLRGPTFARTAANIRKPGNLLLDLQSFINIVRQQIAGAVE